MSRSKREPSYLPADWLAQVSWPDWPPVKDDPLLNRYHVVLALRDILECNFTDAEEQQGGTNLLGWLAEEWGPLSLETLLRVAQERAPATALTPPSDLLDARALSPDTEETKDRASLAEAEIHAEGVDYWEVKKSRFVLTALGATRSEVAREALLPYLSSPLAYERWTTAHWLGYLLEPRALPVLCEMLTEFWPLSQTFASDGGVRYFFEVRQPQVPQMLWRWGDDRVVVPLRQALIQVLRSERNDLPRPQGPAPTIVDQEWASYYYKLREWTSYEHQLVYGLGRLGAFGALMGVETPSGQYDLYADPRSVTHRPRTGSNVEATESAADRFRGNLWRVHASCGYLEPEFRNQVGIDQAFVFFKAVPKLATAVQQVLRDQFGLDEKACQQAMHDYEQSSYLMDTIRYYRQVAKVMAADT